MRVGLNLVFMGANAGGVGRYATELTRALAVHDDIEVHAFIGREFPPEIRHARWAHAVHFTELPVRISGPPLHLAAQFAAIPALAMKRRLDVLHSPANAGPVRIPGVASLITMHDLIWLHAGEGWASAEAIRSMRRVSVPTVTRATRVIAVSRHAADDLVTHLGLDPDRLDVTPHGVRAPDPADGAMSRADVEARWDLGDGPMVLCVAQKRPYKNQEALVRAVASYPDPTLRLVLPGSPTEYERELRALAHDLGCADRVRFPAWIDDRELEGLYARATAFMLPSRYEGFGMPVLEAMVRGVPVACSDRTSLPEVAGDAALLFDPDDQAGVDACLTRLLGDAALRANLERRGRERAARFTWEETAELTLAAYGRARDSA